MLLRDSWRFKALEEAAAAALSSSRPVDLGSSILGFSIITLTGDGGRDKKLLLGVLASKLLLLKLLCKF